MHLVRLEVTNYRRFEEVTIDFPEGVVGIIGNNGAGKSSLVEAIAWVLYGNDVARSSKEEIKRLGANTTEVCQVVLDFEFNGENYRAVRELKGASHTADAAVFVNGKSQARGVTASAELIEKTLGMDWKSFLVSFFARQKELNALSDYQPAKRIEVLSRLLGIERIETAIKRLRQDRRDCQTKLETTRGFMVDANELQQQIQLKMKEQDALTKEISKLELELKVSQVEFKRLSSEFENLKVKKENAQILHQDSEIRKSQVESVAEQLHNLQVEKESILRLVPVQEELKPALVRYSELRELALEQERLKQKLSTQKSIGVQIQAHQELIREDQKRREHLEKDLSQFKEITRELEQTVQSIQEQERAIEEGQKKYNQLSAEGKSLSDQIKNLRQQSERIVELGPDSVCDRCLRPLGKDFDRIREHIQAEMQNLEQKSQISDAGSQSAFQNIKSAKAQRDKLQNQKETLQGKLKQLEQTQSERENLLTRLSQSQTTLQNFQKTFEELSALAYQAEYHRKLQEELQAAESNKEEYLQISERIKILPDLEKKIKDMQDRKSAAEQELKELCQRLKELNFDSTEYQKQEKVLDEKRKNLHYSELSLKDLRYTSSTLAADIKQREEKIKENQIFGRQIQELEEQRKYLEKLDLVMSDFKVHLIGRIRPALSRITRELVGEMTEGKYSEIELDQNYDIYIYEQGQKFGLERFSGGEKDLANLCLRLAISLLITQSAGTEFSFIVLDEIFGSQDQQRKENILKALGNLRNRFRQIFLITHIDDIKDQVESLLHVIENPDGTSRIETSWQYD